jgi:hypothetical protein
MRVKLPSRESIMKRKFTFLALIFASMLIYVPVEAKALFGDTNKTAATDLLGLVNETNASQRQNRNLNRNRNNNQLRRNNQRARRAQMRNDIRWRRQQQYRNYGQWRRTQNRNYGQRRSSQVRNRGNVRYVRQTYYRNGRRYTRLVRVN